MTTVFRNHSTLISIALFLAILITIWLFPSTGLMLGIIFLLFSFVVASSAIFNKHREAYLQGKITRVIFMRNILVEIIGILLALILAGLCGPYIAKIATGQINNDLTRLIAAIIISLLAGMGIGVLVKRAWARFV